MINLFTAESVMYTDNFVQDGVSDFGGERAGIEIWVGARRFSSANLGTHFCRQFITLLVRAMLEDETEVLDWGNEEEDRGTSEQDPSLAAEDAEDAVSLGGDEDDEFLTYQPRVSQGASQRTQSPSKTVNHTEKIRRYQFLAPTLGARLLSMIGPRRQQGLLRKHRRFLNHLQPSTASCRLGNLLMLFLPNQ
ncbi:uncharacterized protein BJ212DRAFT_253438 [Suillus subaureus]|uniref:Uncharacterized protein n=1 Tax=Suillus subaureus TaxID=48587 RepID=A0A9P7JCS2_9AGAM|nr:uncharacterized protein BJ212DRAFT_253438 [Suillus subaureus]KAG1815068.1 hypothetical protein BJ212DRAFT_253438 [Suillus subaureus]